LASARKKKVTKKRTSARGSKTSSKRRFGWGGRRPGAGRKPSPDSGVPHHRREVVKAGDPLLVIHKLKPEYARMAPATLRRIVRDAAEEGGERFGFQLEDARARRGELRLACRARNRRALGRGVQGLSIRIARAINRLRGTEGSVFADRYQLQVFDSDAARRRAL
jgi:hypothetical protein